MLHLNQIYQVQKYCDMIYISTFDIVSLCKYLFGKYIILEDNTTKYLQIFMSNKHIMQNDCNEA